MKTIGVPARPPTIESLDAMLAPVLAFAREWRIAHGEPLEAGDNVHERPEDEGRPEEGGDECK